MILVIKCTAFCVNELWMKCALYIKEFKIHRVAITHLLANSIWGTTGKRNIKNVLEEKKSFLAKKSHSPVSRLELGKSNCWYVIQDEENCAEIHQALLSQFSLLVFPWKSVNQGVRWKSLNLGESHPWRLSLTTVLCIFLCLLVFLFSDEKIHSIT